MESDEAEWVWLKPHAERDAMIVVATGLDLLEVGRALARDDSRQVGEWINRGQLAKPTAEQLASWDQVPTKRFLSLIVQPYVLIQEFLAH